MALRSMTIEEWISYLSQRSKVLLRGTGKELDPYLNRMHEEFEFDTTRATIRCYSIAFGSNNIPLTRELGEQLCGFLVDYSIPRTKILEAQKQDKQNNTSVEMTRLATQARRLFNHLKTSGEGGEVLLYMLIQSILRIPQVLCKMPLKTNPQVHYHGVDGIHAHFDDTSGKLALYWAESKMWADMNGAIKDCLDSLSPFLLNPTQSSRRDLQLLRDNIDLGNKQIQDAFLEFLDPDNVKRRRLEYRGACLIGFDHESYPKVPNEKTEAEVSSAIRTAVHDWNKYLAAEIKKRNPLDRIVLEVFLLPFDSVQTFRDAFLEAL